MPRLEDLAGQMVAGSRAQAPAPAGGLDASLPPDLLAGLEGAAPAGGEGDVDSALETIEASAEGLSPDQAAQVRAHIDALKDIFGGGEATPELADEGSEEPPTSPEPKEV